VALAGRVMDRRHNSLVSPSRSQLEGLRSDAEKLARLLSAALAEEALVEQPMKKAGKLVDTLYAGIHLCEHDEPSSKEQ